MAVAHPAHMSDDKPEEDSLSALSDVDERYLENDPELLLPDIAKPTKAPARSKSAKIFGINARDKTHGRTALHKAASKGNVEKMIELIHDKGAIVDITDNAGVTPLHDACTQGHSDAVIYLIKMGAMISPRDCEGDYPLLDASQNDNEVICRILLEAGANPNIQNTKGESALSEAEEGPVKDLLRQYSSRFESPGQNVMRINDLLTIDKTSLAERPVSSPQRLERIRQRSSRLNIDSQGARKVDINGRDQLHQYVVEEDDDLVEQFLDIQDCNYQDNYGDTPLHSAARSGNAHICGLLLQNGAKLTVKNKRGNTALHEACYRLKNKEVLKALLDAGASSLTKNYDSRTPAQIATIETGADTDEARLLEKTAELERVKSSMKRKKRISKRDPNVSASESARSSPKSTPAQSPNLPRNESTTPGQPEALQQKALGASTQTSISDPVQSADLSRDERHLDLTDAQEIATSIATSASFGIISPTIQKPSSGLPTTQFLTGFRSNCALSHNDSSVRGSPLPLAPIAHDRARDESPRKDCAPLQAEVNAANPVVPSGSFKRKTDSGAAQMPSKSPKRTRTSQGQLSSTDGFLSDTETAQHNNESPEPRDPVTEAIHKLGRDLVGAINKQNVLMTSLLTSINSLVSSLQR